MDREYVIRRLEYLQKWRRGADIPMPNPKEMGMVIDYAIEMLKNNIK